MCTSPLGYLVKWGSHMNLKATFSAKVIASNTVGAFDLHFLSAHGALAFLGDCFHLQEDVQVSIPLDKPLSHWCLHTYQSPHPHIDMVHIHSMKVEIPPCQVKYIITFHLKSFLHIVGTAHSHQMDG
jgi:hypothetical protein